MSLLTGGVTRIAGGGADRDEKARSTHRYTILRTPFLGVKAGSGSRRGRDWGVRCGEYGRRGATHRAVEARKRAEGGLVVDTNRFERGEKRLGGSEPTSDRREEKKRGRE